jgi:hypothetical protein
MKEATPLRLSRVLCTDLGFTEFYQFTNKNSIYGRKKHKGKEWKRISCKQNARWQHLSWLKASAFFSLKKKNLVITKHYNLYLGLVTPSSG